ncbi:ATP-binding cassette domain-containing protein [Pseudonocardia sp. RS11V-5]|uniref:ATP-binding cassette domain-containing protein n=1 Tax=Pseudonocardia terrae TaxID=2905831 RepID=UPI001E651204|nr:ATP-binding cassette domain-containing protein [Pseudonocardia terrae]MCE3555913.1 ATP-binding cassette domain-containing protein [Pseudonocardia terrae]
MTPALLSVDDLRVEFSRGFGKGRFAAVDGVSFEVHPGETVGLVGESGSGKSTTGNAVLGLVRPTGGTVTFDGQDITHLTGRPRRTLSAHLQVVFQDPYSSLNPSRTIAQTLAEPLLVHRDLKPVEIRRAVGEMLERVGLTPADANRHPAAFSGGQRQRIAIARALMLLPKLVICDEAVSALDLSTQAQVLNLLRDLQRDMDLALLFISHDLAVVRYMSHRIVVLQGGKVMEQGTAHQIYTAPEHQYTRKLLDASPVPEPAKQAARRLRREAEALGMGA